MQEMQRKQKPPQARASSGNVLKTLLDVISGILSLIAAAFLIGVAVALFYLGGLFVTIVLAGLAIVFVIALVAWGIWEGLRSNWKS